MTYAEAVKAIMPGARYRHYKGELYTVDFIAMNKSSDENIVVVYHNSSGMHYVRDVKEFTQSIYVSRFSLIQENENDKSKNNQ